MRKFIDANIIYDTNKGTTKEWIEARRCGIGGSDASSIVGLNPHKGVISVYNDKLEDEDISDCIEKSEPSYKMTLTNKLKNFVAKEFTLKTNKKSRSINGILRNDIYPYAIANIDKAIVSERAFLKCVVTNSFMKNKWENKIPANYEVQCHHYMAVSGATHCYIAVLIGNEALIIHKLNRDEKIIDYLMKAEEMFWKECILGEKLPLPSGDEEYSKYLRERYKCSKNEDVRIFIEDDKISRYDEIVENIKELDKEKKSIEQFIQMEMKEYEIGYLGDRKISWKSVSRNTLDSKALKKDYPELASKYMRCTTSRVFKVCS
ncbi:hypothetical protein CHL78_012210 [Romboutsia weinsteinii]|uniref:YqaJ viral recombinase domain-containing protein n=1 Tax=Romboutsia weinsteinii TaxID=2020949 RepID=A0A371J1Q4_9FIRM|nr:YqaJ viral recombinase family protein [Romboutsia weinsteinii]RDY26709.1 hypothetical protein CHL78_012210 [Romboutsia weinsteinii]